MLREALIIMQELYLKDSAPCDLYQLPYYKLSLEGPGSKSWVSFCPQVHSSFYISASLYQPQNINPAPIIVFLQALLKLKILLVFRDLDICLPLVIFHYLSLNQLLQTFQVCWSLSALFLFSEYLHQLEISILRTHTSNLILLDDNIMFNSP